MAAVDDDGASRLKSFVKIVVVGESSVGKTCLLHQHVEHRYTESYKPTIGADFHTLDTELDGRSVTVQYWDTAGQERFHSLGAAFYRGADACILVYDKTRPSSFRQLDFWRGEFLAQAAPDQPDAFPFIVAGNKRDLARDAGVGNELAAAWCKKRNAQFFDVSAKDNINVRELFHCAIREAVARRATVGGDDDDELPRLDLAPQTQSDTEDSGTCCA